MAQPLRGLAPQIPNASLVWNLNKGRFTRIIGRKRDVVGSSHPLRHSVPAPLVLQVEPNVRVTLRIDGSLLPV